MTRIRMPSAVSAMVLRAENLEPCAIGDVDAFRDAMELFATHLIELEIDPDDFHSLVLSAVESAERGYVSAESRDDASMYITATRGYFFLLASVGFSQGHDKSRVLRTLLRRNQQVAAALAESYVGATDEALRRELNDICESCTHTVIASQCPSAVQ